MFQNWSFTKKIKPLKQGSIHMAIHTPRSPIDGASRAASDMRTPHIETRFMMLGTSVFAAPTNAP